MSGKYYKFTLPDEVINTKKDFCDRFKISMRKMDSLLTKEKGYFSLNGQRVYYEIVYKLVSNRDYIPNPNGKNGIVININEYQKRVGDLILIYSSTTNKLIKTISV